MKRGTTAVFVGLVVLACTACGRSEQAPPPPNYQVGDTLRVTGTLLDTRCYALDHDHVTNTHTHALGPGVHTRQEGGDEVTATTVPEGKVVACGTACARLGYPVAVLENGDPEGKVWVLVTVAQALADYVEGTVRVTALFRSDGVLIPTRLELKSGDTWTFIL